MPRVTSGFGRERRVSTRHHRMRVVPFEIQPADLLTIALLVVLEGLLSADNALVMAVMVLGLPKAEHRKVLSYGLVGAFLFRILATLLAIYLIKLVLAKLLGGLYLLYLTFVHFSRRGGAAARQSPPPARPAFGLSAFWAAVVRIELVNLAFSIDSILVAVAMSPKRWVVITGGVLGIIAMRVVVGQLLRLIQKYPALVDGAFVIIAWVALKLIADYAHAMHWISWDIPQTLELAIVVSIFVGAYIYARWVGPKSIDEP
jgi:YkoY family integral membrane protein